MIHGSRSSKEIFDNKINLEKVYIIATIDLCPNSIVSFPYPLPNYPRVPSYYTFYKPPKRLVPPKEIDFFSLPKTRRKEVNEGD